MTSEEEFMKEYFPIIGRLFARMKEKHKEFGVSYQEMQNSTLHGRIMYKNVRLNSALFDPDSEDDPIKEALDVAIYALLLADNVRRDRT